MRDEIVFIDLWPAVRPPLSLFFFGDCRRCWVNIGSMMAAGSMNTLGIHSFFQYES